MAGRLRDTPSRRYRNRRRPHDQHAQRPRVGRARGPPVRSSLTCFEAPDLDANHQSWLK
jgi:hypothetical protein